MKAVEKPAKARKPKVDKDSPSVAPPIAHHPADRRRVFSHAHHLEAEQYADLPPEVRHGNNAYVRSTPPHEEQRAFEMLLGEDGGRQRRHPRRLSPKKNDASSGIFERSADVPALQRDFESGAVTAYDILGVSSDASSRQLEGAYLELRRKCNAGPSCDDTNKERLALLNMAYEQVRDMGYAEHAPPSSSEPHL